jgi:hypothetical protein
MTVRPPRMTISVGLEAHEIARVVAALKGGQITRPLRCPPSCNPHRILLITDVIGARSSDRPSKHRSSILATAVPRPSRSRREAHNRTALLPLSVRLHPTSIPAQALRLPSSDVRTIGARIQTAPPSGQRSARMRRDNKEEGQLRPPSFWTAGSFMVTQAMFRPASRATAP